MHSPPATCTSGIKPQRAPSPDQDSTPPAPRDLEGWARKPRTRGREGLPDRPPDFLLLHPRQTPIWPSWAQCSHPGQGRQVSATAHTQRCCDRAPLKPICSDRTEEPSTGVHMRRVRAEKSVPRGIRGSPTPSRLHFPWSFGSVGRNFWSVFASLASWETWKLGLTPGNSWIPKIWV